VIRTYEAISPIAHDGEPTHRGPVIEEVLDHLDPVFDGCLPVNAYVWGPPGTGKSAVLTALCAQLARLSTGAAPVIHTSTRAQPTDEPGVVYVDARRATSPFGLYRALLDGLLDERVPEQGVKTETLREQLVDVLRPADRQLVVTVDHLNESGSLHLSQLTDSLSPITESVAWIAVGQSPPDELKACCRPADCIEVPPYERHVLVDVLTARASDGLTQGAISHDQRRRLADWAAGNAHDALAALFCAADFAEAGGHERIRDTDLTDGMHAVPRPSAALGRLDTLSQSRRLVVRQLIDLDESTTESVGDAANAIAESAAIDLSPRTITRFLYELAEEGIVQRVPVSSTTGAGRPPSRLEPRFPTRVFRRLYDLDEQ
jgi:Cdc6-like AAA superfamily ATPase